MKKKDNSCKNNIGIIRNLEIKFYDENCYNYNNITFICYIYHLWTMHSFLTILKLFKVSGLQTKMAFKQRFKYEKNEKVNFIKVILKLESIFL